MFERYTEKARRVIFFARYEASMFGSPNIETEHMLLGLLREDKRLTHQLIGLHTVVESIRHQVEQNTAEREKISTSVDLPLSNECKRVIAYAAEEAERLSQRHIGTEHLLLGLLRESESLAARLLTEYVTLAAAREKVSKMPPLDQRPNDPPLGQGRPGSPLTLRQHGTQTSLGHFELDLKVADIHASIAFYAALGFRPVSSVWNDEYAVVENGQCRIALYRSQITENLLTFCGGDLSAIAQRTTAAGLTFEKPPSTSPDGTATALLRDPDGNAIYLVSHPGEE